MWEVVRKKSKRILMSIMIWWYMIIDKKECCFVWVNMCIINVKLKNGEWVLVRKWVWVYICVSGWKKMCKDIWVRNGV